MSTSLSRAFTTKRNKPKDIDVSAALPQRSLTTKHSFAPGAVRAKKISGPVELISTTNMLSYHAPDIYPRSRSSTTSSSMSDGQSSRSSNDGSSPSSVGTPFTSPETSSIESSPTSALPEPNHLSCYFGTAIKSAADEEAPTIPTRALSHTKKSAEYLARKRSISSRMSSPKNSISRISGSNKHSMSSSTSTARSSINMFSPNPETVDHPFGNELAQVSELVEEIGSAKELLPVVSEEEQELVTKGLFRFRAEDYMSEISDLITSTFGELPKPQMSALWI